MAALNTRAWYERSFPNSPSSVAAARHFVLDVIRDTDEDVRGEVAIMVSELATNAIVHARTKFRVRIEVRDDDTLRVAVFDGSARAAQLQAAPTPEQVNGRGLRIVHEFADDWGAVTDPSGRGKTVWFTVKAPARLG